MKRPNLTTLLSALVMLGGIVLAIFSKILFLLWPHPDGLRLCGRRLCPIFGDPPRPEKSKAFASYLNRKPETSYGFPVFSMFRRCDAMVCLVHGRKVQLRGIADAIGDLFYLHICAFQ